ncbi:MAG: hypothetical protein JWM25_1861, partial [Thermoleophilia bacterium]|nr:hypothetical protein [Thermoleophilia bacterium]
MRRESGFTIVEVLIAVLILAVVASGVAFATAGGAKLRGVAKLQASLTSAGVRAQEDLVTDRSWMERADCRKVNDTCNVTTNVRPGSLKLDGIGGGSAILKLATSTAVDGKVDGVGPADKDGVTPDYFRIDLELGVDAALAARYGSTPAKLRHEMSVSIDRRGVEQVGSLVVEVCRVTNQSDERMTLQGCAPTGATGIRMNGCPPAPRPGCASAFNWIAGMGQSETAPSPFVTMRRVTVPFTLRNTDGTTWPSTGSVTPEGLVVFQNVPAGDYNLVGLPESAGSGSERWDSKEVPAFHGAPGRASVGPSVVVEPGVRNRALVLFRPTPAGSIGMYFDRVVKDYHLGGTMQTGGEYVVPVKTPTSAYLGGSATEFCALFNGLGLVTCTLASTAPNCMTAYATGFDFIPVAGGGDFNVDNQTGIYPALDGNGTLLKYTFTNRPYGEFCTTYSEQHTYTYYARTGGISSRILPGAVAGAGYQVMPAPDSRIVDVAGGTATIPTASCVVPKRGQCAGLKPLQAGLNTPMITTPGDVANAASNENVIPLPAWLRSGGIWVSPGGQIVTPSGAAGTNPVVKARGIGECYWTSVRYSGAQEGPCDPCSPVFDPGVVFSAACSILTRDAVVRIVIEHKKQFSLRTGAVDNASDEVIATDAYSI